MPRPDSLPAMLRRLAAATVAIVALLIHTAYGGEAAPAADDPVLEKRVTALAELLRCLVCQNQSIADSHADLAIDLKQQIREKIRAGQSDKEIVDYMVARYGDFVLYKPPVKATTVVLWVGPFVLLAGGLGLLVHRLRARVRRARADEALSDEEHQRAAALLREQPAGKEGGQ